MNTMKLNEQHETETTRMYEWTLFVKKRLDARW